MEVAPWKFIELLKPRWVLETKDEELFHYDLRMYVKYGTNTLKYKKQ